MNDPYEISYVLAKSQAMFSAFCLGKTLKKLAHCSNLHELYRETFGGAAPPLSEFELLKTYERMTKVRLCAKAESIFGCFEVPPPILKALVSYFDIVDLKQGIAALKKDDPFEPLAKGYSYADFSFWPDISRMVTGTPFSWLEPVWKQLPMLEIENRLDRQYFEILWDVSGSLKGDEHEIIRFLIRSECELQNIIWAFRQKVFFGLKLDAIQDELVMIKDIDVVSSALFGVAFDLAKPEFSQKWKWKALLDPSPFDSRDRLLPKILEHNAVAWIFAKYRASFHKAQFSMVPSYCFLRLAMFEADALKSCAEAVRLSVPPVELESFLGVMAC